ncbi:peptide ABC transporter substrate-binding protein [Maricaulis virginensis]|uniref:ABC transporter permease n=1 Tax=Maricaulis virginensis TaxID=144022 RepID=A0A9W6MPP5_9PROT|nr:peptide ABC transporter substrate-binding protein [Maricaulis virginensis]GLK53845.1 ABC transporter permease [Maricaulis virginensis]
MLNRRTLLAASLATGLAGCSRSAPPDGLLRVATTNLPDSLDPARGEFASAALAYKQLHAGLTEYAADGSVAPGLAESWTFREDGRRWYFHLRDGLTWSDGHPLTAEDVVWSARRLVDPAQSFAQLGDFFAIENARAVLAGEMLPEAMGVAALNERSVEFRLTNPLGLLPVLMREFYPFPRHVIERHGADWVRPENLVTAGAYTLTGESQLHLSMTRNPAYYDAARVAIPAIRLDAVQDAATRVRLFRAGDYDLADQPPANQIGFLRDRLGERFRSFDAPILRYLKLNHARAPLAAAETRRALSGAIDRAFIAGEFFAGTASPTRHVVPVIDPEAGAAGASPALEIGRPLQIRTTPGDNERIALAVADDWQRAGVETEIFVTYATDLYQAVDAGDYDVAVASFNRGLKADPFFMLDPFAPGGFADNFNWQDAEFAGAMARARRETDPAARALAYQQAEARLFEETAIIPLLHERAHWMVSDRVAGTRSDIQPMLWRELSLLPTELE